MQILVPELSSMKIKNTIETSHAFLILLKRSVNNLKTRTYIQGKMMLALSTLCVFTPPPRKSFKMRVIKVQFSTLYYSKTTKHHQYLGGPPRHQPVYCSKKPKKCNSKQFCLKDILMKCFITQNGHQDSYEVNNNDNNFYCIILSILDH